MRLNQTEMAKTAFLAKMAGFLGRHKKVHFLHFCHKNGFTWNNQGKNC